MAPETTKDSSSLFFRESSYCVVNSFLVTNSATFELWITQPKAKAPTFLSFEIHQISSLPVGIAPSRKTKLKNSYVLNLHMIEFKTPVLRMRMKS